MHKYEAEQQSDGNKLVDSRSTMVTGQQSHFCMKAFISHKNNEVV